MWKDPIIEEARKRREELAGKFGHELDAIARHKKEGSSATGRATFTKGTPREKVA
ncbi:hypothetical protein MASR1M12_45720 [Erysipelotrichia bacterium]